MRRTQMSNLGQGYWVRVAQLEKALPLFVSPELSGIWEIPEYRRVPKNKYGLKAMVFDPDLKEVHTNGSTPEFRDLASYLETQLILRYIIQCPILYTMYQKVSLISRKPGKEQFLKSFFDTADVSVTDANADVFHGIEKGVRAVDKAATVLALKVDRTVHVWSELPKQFFANMGGRTPEHRVQSKVTQIVMEFEAIRRHVIQTTNNGHHYNNDEDFKQKVLKVFTKAYRGSPQDIYAAIDLVNLQDYYSSRSPEHQKVGKWRRPARNYFMRLDITPDIMEAAWDAVLMAEVHEV